MKLRIYAIVATLAAAGLGVALWQQRAANAELTGQVTRLGRQNADLSYGLKQASRQAEDFGQRAVELDAQLGSAKTRTTATESKQTQLTRELNDTRNRLTEREQREVALMAELATLRQKVAGAGPGETPRGEVAAAPVGAQAPASDRLGDGRIPPADTSREPAEDTTASQRRITELEQQLTEMLTRALAEPAAQETALPAGTPYQVVRVGPHDSFVVLDYGAEQGARPQQILSLRRGTREMARVQISDARPRFSLAQVLPATLKGQLQTGDLTVLTH